MTAVYDKEKSSKRPKYVPPTPSLKMG